METSTGKQLMIDAHHHLWNLEALHYPWLASGGGDAMFGDFTPLCQDYLISDYLTDTGGAVVKSVHIQAEHDEINPVAETRWLQALADDPAGEGFPHGIVAFADFTRADVGDVLAAHREFANVRGIRQIVTHHDDPRLTHAPRDYLKDDAWCARIALLAEFGLSFDLQLYPHQMPAAVALIDAHPDTTFILNHTGSPVRQDATGVAEWRAGMAALAERHNVMAKISGLGMFDPAWTTQSIRPFVRETIGLFGVDRCMFASNFPVDRLFRDFAATIGAFAAIVADLTEADRQQLFHDNAERYYRL